MTALLLAAALSQAPLESYADLNRTQLLEQRRLLKENTPRLIAPILMLCGTTFPVMGFGTLFGIGAGAGEPTRTNFFIGGSVLTVFAIGVFATGLIWLFKTMAAQDSAAARSEEIQALLESTNPGPMVPPPPPPP